MADAKISLRDFLPPVLFKFGRALSSGRERRHSAKGTDTEKDADWYDANLERAGNLKLHYTDSKYYFFWSVIVDRIMQGGIAPVLDIGCGTGQLAAYLRDRGLERYHGFDFSELRVAQALEMCPQFTFTVEDAYKTTLFEEYDYGIVICTEFLEHVDGDVEVLQKIRPGTRFYGSVPNFPYESHVRHFKDCDEVQERYRSYFTSLRVDAFKANTSGKTYFLMDGIV